MRRLPVLLAATLAFAALAACSSPGDEAAEAGTTAVTEEAATTGDGGSAAETGNEIDAPSTSDGDLSAQEVADRIVELDTALEVEFREGPQPVAISIPSVGVNASPIDGVGVEPNGELEVPSAKRVGWYEYGPSPGQVGSSVLAAHIASDGVDGAFRYLSDANVGDQVEVVFDDDSSQTYEIIEMAQYDKDELPFDRVFAREGEPVITLITCGGTFQPSVGSYEDNIVAYAIPLSP